MKKRLIRFVVALLVIVGGLIWLRNREAISSPPPSQADVLVSNWNSSVGAISDTSTSMDKQKLSFQATVWNNSGQATYVKAVEVEVPASLRDHILSGESVIPVQRTLKPNAATKVSGQFILNTKGMTKQQIINLGHIQGFTVQTGQ